MVKLKAKPLPEPEGPFADPDCARVDLTDAPAKPAAVAAEEEEDDWDLLKDEGRVMLNTPCGSSITWVVHKTLVERAPLPEAGRGWKLVWGGGFAAAACSNDAVPPIPVGELFKKKSLWIDSRGEIHIEDVASHNVVSLGDLNSRFERVEVSWSTGALGSFVKHSTYRIMFPRHAFMFYWDLIAFYGPFKLETYEGVPSCWAWHQQDGFRQRGRSLFGSDEHVATSEGATDSKRATLPIGSLVLPTTSVSTALLVGLAPRWVQFPCNGGGFPSDKSKNGARELLAGWAAVATNQEGYSMSLVHVVDWQPPWPGKEEREPFIVLNVDREGMFSVDALESAMLDLGNKVVWRAVAKELAAVTRGRLHRASVDELLLALVKVPRVTYLFCQVAWKLAWRLETMMLRSLSGKGAAAIKTSIVDIMDVMWNNKRLDQELVKQLLVSADHARNFLNWTYASDEAHVGGPSLANTVVVCRDNVALPMLPQAPLGRPSGLWGGWLIPK